MKKKYIVVVLVLLLAAMVPAVCSAQTIVVGSNNINTLIHNTTNKPILENSNGNKINLSANTTALNGSFFYDFPTTTILDLKGFNLLTTCISVEAGKLKIIDSVGGGTIRIMQGGLTLWVGSPVPGESVQPVLEFSGVYLPSVWQSLDPEIVYCDNGASIIVDGKVIAGDTSLVEPENAVTIVDATRGNILNTRLSTLSMTEFALVMLCVIILFSIIIRLFYK